MAWSGRIFLNEHCFASKEQYLYYKISLVIHSTSRLMEDTDYANTDGITLTTTWVFLLNDS